MGTVFSDDVLATAMQPVDGDVVAVKRSLLARLPVEPEGAAVTVELDTHEGDAVVQLREPLVRHGAKTDSDGPARWLERALTEDDVASVFLDGWAEAPPRRGTAAHGTDEWMRARICAPIRCACGASTSPTSPSTTSRAS